MHNQTNEYSETADSLRVRPVPNPVRERGASLVEYALVVGLIAVVALVAVGLLGGSVSDSLGTSASALEAAPDNPKADYPTETAGVDGKVNATFLLVDGQVVLDSTNGDGWTMTVLKDTDTRINTRFKNNETGEIIRVNGWVNAKGQLKTNVVEK